MLEFDCSFFQQTVPQYNLEHMSIDNMHNESVGIFVHKMACDNFSHFQNRAIQIRELIRAQEKHALKLDWMVMLQWFKINETNKKKKKRLPSNYIWFDKKDYVHFKIKCYSVTYVFLGWGTLSITSVIFIQLLFVSSNYIYFYCLTNSSFFGLKILINFAPWINERMLKGVM